MEESRAVQLAALECRSIVTLDCDDRLPTGGTLAAATGMAAGALRGDPALGVLAVAF